MQMNHIEEEAAGHGTLVQQDGCINLSSVLWLELN